MVLGQKSAVPTRLLCDMRTNPLGIESRQPCFSWQLPTDYAAQAAYRIMVASSQELLTLDKPDMWDSGRIEASQSLHIPYHGTPLKPGSLYYWVAQVWTTNGNAPLCSAPAHFVTGLWDDWKANWIWTGSISENQHVFFRKVLHAPTKPIRHVYAFVSADDYYKLYVNGMEVGQGPAPSYPRIQHNYNTIDLTHLWYPGKPFCLAAHTYYQGLSNYAWVSGDGLAGFLLQLHVEFSDGSKLITGTGESWHCWECAAYQSGHKLGYNTGFNENIDARRLPEKWKTPDYDDSHWPNAQLVLPAPWRLHAQETEMLSVYELAPAELTQTEDGRVYFDFGQEIAGSIHLDLWGNDGAQIDVRLGEELIAPTHVRHNLRCNCNYQDTWTLRDGWQSLELYDYRGFRFGEISGAPDPSRVAVRAIVRHYPFAEDAAAFACANPALNQMWDLAKRTLRAGTQDVYLDCPTREKGAYSLDTYLQMAAAFYLAGEWNLGRRMIEYLLQSSSDGKARCLAPAGKEHFFTEYTMYPVLMAWFYYEHTGDASFLQRNYAALAQIERYMRESFRQSDGLLHNTDAVLKDLVDWPVNRRDGHEMLSVNIVVNAVYYRVTKVMSCITCVCGQLAAAQQYSALAEQVANAVNTKLWDSQNERYVDGMSEEELPANHASLHANAFPLAMGLVPSNRIVKVVEYMKSRGFNCNMFLAMFLFEALYDSDAAEYGEALLLGSGEDSPLHMVRKGATTTWEAWDLDQKWNTSLFHPAGAFTGYIIGSRIMGITPLEAGFRRIKIKPQIGNLVWGRIKTPTLYGPVSMSFEQLPGQRFRMVVDVPPNTTAQVWLPIPNKDRATVRLDGVVCASSQDDAYVCIDEVGAGCHVLEIA